MTNFFLKFGVFILLISNISCSSDDVVNETQKKRDLLEGKWIFFKRGFELEPGKIVWYSHVFYQDCELATITFNKNQTLTYTMIEFCDFMGNIDYNFTLEGNWIHCLSQIEGNVNIMNHNIPSKYQEILELTHNRLLLKRQDSRIGTQYFEYYKEK